MLTFSRKAGNNIEKLEKPKVVWKILYNYDKKTWRPIYFGSTHLSYNIDLEATDHLFIKDDRIYKGFHAFTNPDKAYEEMKKLDVVNKDLLEVVRAVIPGNAEYCLGDNNQIVSNRILVFNDEKKLENYIITWNTKIAEEDIIVKKDIQLGEQIRFNHIIKTKAKTGFLVNLNSGKFFAIIPKGTRYREDKTKNLETEQVIVFSNEKRFNKYIKKKRVE